MDNKIFEKMYKMGAKIATENKDLISKTGYSPVAAVVMGASGKLYTGLSVGWYHSTCAEIVAISNAWQAGERELKYITAVKFNKRNNQLQPLTPCGICRQMFFELQPEIKIVYLKDGEWEVKSVSQLLPDKYQ